MKKTFGQIARATMAGSFVALFASCASNYDQQRGYAAQPHYGDDPKGGSPKYAQRAEPVYQAEPAQHARHPQHPHGNAGGSFLNNFFGSVHLDSRGGVSIGAAVSGGNAPPVHHHGHGYGYNRMHGRYIPVVPVPRPPIILVPSPYYR